MLTLASPVWLVCGTLPHAAIAQDDQPPAKGWLQGRLLLPTGQPLGFMASIGVAVTEIDGHRNGISTGPKSDLGGLYEFRDIAPGVYELTVGGGNVKEAHARPLRIWGVVIRPGVRSTLNINLKDDEDGSGKLDEIGQPPVPTVPVLIVS
jgi:hypothetical protein